MIVIFILFFVFIFDRIVVSVLVEFLVLNIFKLVF